MHHFIREKGRLIKLELKAKNKIFEGSHQVFSHWSESTKCEMNFSIYLPTVNRFEDTPTLFWLSGLTCTEENFRVKSGVQRYASAMGVNIIAPDTSPRGENVPDDPNYDFAQGAGFYLDAMQSPWDENFKMYSYITNDLLNIAKNNFSINEDKLGIFGHSMGGHGALTIALKNPDIFKSVSAFAPICAPTQVPWGRNAFEKYLGSDEESWQQYDATQLIHDKGWSSDILVDQGLEDEFMDEHLKPELLEDACIKNDISLSLRKHEGYDHSYFFISSFIEDHISWHKERL